MTSQCKFDLGNRGLAQAAMGTVSESNLLSVAARMRTCRRQHKRTQGSTVSANEERRASTVCAKAIMTALQQFTCVVSSSVSRRSHAGKAIQGNLGEPITSKVLNQQRLVLLTLVAAAISFCEGSGDALWGVGEAHSIGECGDSITPREKRSLA